MRLGFGLQLTAVVVLGLGIGAGLAACQSAQQSPAKAAASNAAPAATQQGGGQAGQQRGGPPAAGIVSNVGDKQFTVKSGANGTPVVVRIDDRTAFRKQASGTLADVKQGERISVEGDAKADGSVTATAVQIVAAESGAGPQGAQGQGRGQFGQQGAQSGGGGRGQGGQGTPPAGGTRQQGGQGRLVGTVKNVANNVITLARSGGSAAGETDVQAAVSDQTKVTKTVDGSLNDVAEGVYVVAIGPSGADGVITATSVQILPADAAGVAGRQQ